MKTKAGERRGSDSDLALIDRIERGEGDAFAHLVDTHGPALLRVASYHAPSRAVAEEIVQETWIAFLVGLASFEGRSTLRTWLFGILINQARKIARRERRTVTFDPEPDSDAELGLDPSRFMPDGGRWAGHWRLDDLSVWPRRWSELPEHRVLRDEVRAEIATALATLPASQQIVFTLRDIEGFAAAEVCQILELTDANQRVLLHRARSRVRAHLEAYFDD